MSSVSEIPKCSMIGGGFGFVRETMRKIFLQILVGLLLVVSIAAQLRENEPQLIDEFGKMPLDETIARIDALGNEIGKTSNSKALIRISGGQGTYFAAAYVRGSLMKAIWNNFRKFAPERLSIQFCDVDQTQIRARFYVVRENDRVEPCAENLTAPKETVLFDSVYFYSPVFKPTPLEASDIGHFPSEGEYSQFAQNVLKRLLNDSPPSRVYVIAYLQINFERDERWKIIEGKLSDLDNRAYAGKMMQAARNNLIKNGFSPAQIVMRDGGYVNVPERRLEFWLVPPGGAIPKPQPDYFSQKKRRK
jgi:hypothetical protein